MPTCFEIYETYQRGPAAVLRLFEEALGTRAIYGPPPPDMQQRTIDSLSEDIGRLKRQVSRLKAALGEARGEVDWLRRRNTELEKLVTKDSHNSSRPPSTDPPWAKRTKSLRRPSGRRVGGQPRPRRPHVAADAEAAARHQPPPGAVSPLLKDARRHTRVKRRAAAGRRADAGQAEGHRAPGGGSALHLVRTQDEGGSSPRV